MGIGWGYQHMIMSTYCAVRNVEKQKQTTRPE